MASDPNALLQLLAQNGGLQGQAIQNNVNQQQDQQLGQAQVEQQLQAGAVAQQQQAQQAAAAAQKARDMQTYLANPTPAALGAYARAHPEDADSMVKAYNAMDDVQKTSQLTQAGQIYSSADNNRPDLVAHQLTQMKAAELAENPNTDTSAVDDALTELASGDPSRVKAALASAKGIAQIHIAAADPAKFAETYSDFGGGDDTAKAVTFGSGGVGHYEGTKFVVDQAPSDGPKDPRQNYIEIKNADGTTTQHYIGNGNSGTSGAPAAGRTTGGWTPRQANGGDNPDAAVDSKISGAASFLGVPPTADISGMSPMKIAQAMTLSEGGAGSLADRNNNPANLRNPDGSYKVFPTKQAGLTAAAALVARKLKNGQTTIQTMIEGLPVGGSAVSGGSRDISGAPATGGAANIKPGDISTVPQNIRSTVQAIVDGRSAPPRPGTKFGEALLDAATAFDPTFDAANANSRVKTRVDFTSGKSAQNITAMNTAMGHLLHLDDQAHDLGNFSTLPGIINPIYNSVRSASGNTSLGAFEQTKQAASSELRKVFAGSGGGNLEELRQFEANLSSSKSPEQIHTVIQNAVELLGSRLSALQDQYAQGMGRSDKIPTFIKPSLARQAQVRFGVDLGASSSARSGSAPAGQPVPANAARISSPADIAKLPHGAPFIIPSGPNAGKVGYAR